MKGYSNAGTNASGIRFKDDKIIWGNLKLNPIFDKKDKHGVQAQRDLYSAYLARYDRAVKFYAEALFTANFIVGATGWSPNSIMQQFPKGRPAGRPYNL
ncbi:MAG: hypothetical protein HQK76_20280 [Desulfobacterales bacterium]|nr:hypothetical protein [Desulfobacterales bacterium]